MMKVKKQILAIVLGVGMVLCLLPGIVLAQGPTGGTSHIADKSVLAINAATNDAAMVYFGSEGDPIKWRVVEAGDGQLTLLSLDIQGMTEFGPTNTNAYKDSYLHQAITAIADAKLSAAEKTAVVKRDLTVSEFNKYDTDGIAGEPVDDQVLWPLSTKEVMSMNTAVGGSILQASFDWWTRSPGNPMFGNALAGAVSGAGVVDENGRLVADINVLGVRPAFYLNLNQVLFASAADNGKSDVLAGNNPIFENESANDTNEWKLTVLDDAHANFKAEYQSTDGNTVKISYENANTTDTNGYISVIVQDNTTKEYTHYVKLEKVTGENGTVRVDLTGVDMSNKTLYVFNEQCNDAKKTDYASPLQPIDLSNQKATNDWNSELTIDGWTYGEYDAIENAPKIESQYGEPTYWYSDSEDGPWTTTVPTEAGTYYVKATVEATDEYEGLESDPVSFVIKQANGQVTIIEDLDKLYDGEAVKDPQVDTHGSTGKVTFTWEVEQDGTWKVLDGAPTNPGHYRVTATLAPDRNYTQATASKTFTITEKTTKPNEPSSGEDGNKEEFSIIETGANSHLMMWGILMLVSLAVMSIAMTKQRKYNK